MKLTSRQKLRNRDTNTRDAKAFVIATEGAETERKYFEAFNVVRPFERSRVSVKVLPPLNDRSAPQHVLQRLREFVNGQKLDPRDEIWLVIDVDTWEEHTLAKVCAAAKRLRFNVSVSHPCFEVWLCFHFQHCDDEIILQHTLGRDAPQKLKKLWRSHLPKSATQIELTVLRPLATIACQRARNYDHGDIDAAHPWPAAPGTRVYQLVERILKMLVK